MPPPPKAKTLTAGINCSADQLYAFVSSPANLPAWATTFARSIQHLKGDWLLQTDQGPVKIRIAEKNSFGILDHFIIPATGHAVYVPMRVVPNGDSTCEVLFTLFQDSEITDEQFKKDQDLVCQDLNTLKRLMENC